jgi:hypothetical protein
MIANFITAFSLPRRIGSVGVADDEQQVLSLDEEDVPGMPITLRNQGIIWANMHSFDWTLHLEKLVACGPVNAALK